MRILVTTGPAYGHLLPMLPLAGAARRAGHEVVIATGAELVPEIEERGFTAWPVGPSWAEAEGMLRESYSQLPEDPSPQERLRAAAAGLFGAPAARRATELVPRAQEWGPELVVHEVSELAGGTSGPSRLVVTSSRRSERRSRSRLPNRRRRARPRSRGKYRRFALQR